MVKSSKHCFLSAHSEAGATPGYSGTLALGDPRSREGHLDHPILKMQQVRPGCGAGVAGTDTETGQPINYQTLTTLIVSLGPKTLQTEWP